MASETNTTADARLDGIRREAESFARSNEHVADDFEPGGDAIADEVTSFRRAHAAVRESGLFDLVVPAAHGGADVDGLAGADTVSVRALAAVRRELAFRHAMLDLAFVEQGLGSFPIVLGGGAATHADWLERVRTGDAIPALGLTEPGAGSDLSAVATKAECDGDGWRLTGTKTYITNVGVADFYTVLARTSGAPGERDGTTMFLVPHETPGVRIEPFRVHSPHPIGEVHFEGARVPGDHRLGDEGGGIDLALANLGRFRITVAAAAIGFARRALAESVTHLKSREQFGRPLATFQGLRFDLAEMDTRLRAAELLTDEAAALVDAGADATAEVARAKLHATETASWVCDRAVQHHGGSGVRIGSVVERLLRDTRALRIYEGTSEIQKLVLAKHVLSHTPDPAN